MELRIALPSQPVQVFSQPPYIMACAELAQLSEPGVDVPGVNDQAEWPRLTSPNGRTTLLSAAFPTFHSWHEMRAKSCQHGKLHVPLEGRLMCVIGYLNRVYIPRCFGRTSPGRF